MIDFVLSVQVMSFVVLPYCKQKASVAVICIPIKILIVQYLYHLKFDPYLEYNICIETFVL